MNLRTRIKKDMIYCLPWKVWKHELILLPISSQTLFARRGISIDILEAELKLEGWIHQNEVLLEVLKIQNNLNRRLNEEDKEEEVDIGDFPEDWTEKDFLYYIEEKHKGQRYEST